MPNFESGTINPASATQVSVGITSTQIVAANINRQGLILINVTGGTISLGIDQPAVLNSGMTLAPLGVFNMAEYDYFTHAVNGIGSSTGVIAVQEFIR